MSKETPKKRRDEKRRKKMRRRGFLKASAVGITGISAGGATQVYGDESNGGGESVGKPNQSNVDSSDLEITDLRYTVLDEIPFPSIVVKVYTNDEEIYGLGEMRPQGDPRFALMLKNLVLGKNPLNMEEIYREIRRYGSHGRAGGGVAAIDMALHDIVGKYYGIPAHQLIGGQYREKVRLYSDTSETQDPQETGELLQDKIDRGYTALKVDIGIDELSNADVEGALVNSDQWEDEDGGLSQYGNLSQGATDPNGITGPHYGRAEQPMTRIQITETGLDWLEDYIGTVRDIIGYDVPLGVDHIGHFPVNEHLQLAERWKQFDLAYMENVTPWFYTDQWKEFTDNTTVPGMSGESIYGLDPTPYRTGDPDHGFKALIDERAVDLIHPDPGSAGGISETKKIADYAHNAGIPMFLHFAGSPVGAVASTHIAAASRNFVALENHSDDVDVWEDLVVRTGEAEGEGLFTDDGVGFYDVPEAPGLGIDLNEELARDYVTDDESWFAATDDDEGWFGSTEEWNEVQTRQFWE